MLKRSTDITNATVVIGIVILVLVAVMEVLIYTKFIQ